MQRGRFGFGLPLLLAALMGLSACGSSELTSASTTTGPVDPDLCPALDTSRLPTVREPSGATSESARQQELMGDAERVRQYGQGFPEAFNDVWFDYRDDRWILTAGFKSGVDEHRAALRTRVEHADRLVVCRTARSAADRQRITVELTAIANDRPVVTSFAVGIDRTTVGLRADQEALANELYEKYRPSIDIMVGLFPYPPTNAGTANVRCPTIDAVAAPNGLRITAEPESTSFASGTGPRTTVHIRNSTATRYRGSQGAIYLVRPGTRTVVGVHAGPHDAMLRTFDAGPGEERSYDDAFGTAPCAWNGAYTLPKGTYEVLVTVNVEGIGMVVGEPIRVVLT